MQSALKTGISSECRWLASGIVAMAALAASPGWAQTPPAQTPAAQPQQPAAPNSAPAQPSAAPPPQPAAIPAPQPSQPQSSFPRLNVTPVAIVAVDRSVPGAAYSVTGPIMALNGRAFLTASGQITAGQQTAVVTLPYRGTLRVCAASTVQLAADAGARVGDVPGLLIALDHGAVEMSFAASHLRQQNVDSLLTPYFRILIGGPNAADVRVRLGENGDTCVDNAGNDAPYVVVTSVFEGGLYRVQPGQRVMFEHGSLSTVNEQEQEPCGCPPPPEMEANAFPLAQSEGLSPANAPPVVTTAPESQPGAMAALSYSGTEHAAAAAAVPPAPAAARPKAPAPAPASAAPAPPPAPAASATPDAAAPSKPKKKGFFRKLGHFFGKVFGAE